MFFYLELLDEDGCQRDYPHNIDVRSNDDLNHQRLRRLLHPEDQESCSIFFFVIWAEKISAN